MGRSRPNLPLEINIHPQKSNACCYISDYINTLAHLTFDAQFRNKPKQNCLIKRKGLNVNRLVLKKWF